MSEYSLEFHIALAIAGALGACLRYGVDRLLHQKYPTAFPSGIMAVNLSGAFLIGLVSAIAASGFLEEPQYQVLALGFAGSYTTFSGWMVQSLELYMSGYERAAVINLLITLIPGWLLTLAGWWLGLQL